jgi:hypothetical protein
LLYTLSKVKKFLVLFPSFERDSIEEKKTGCCFVNGSFSTGLGFTACLGNLLSRGREVSRFPLKIFLQLKKMNIKNIFSGTRRALTLTAGLGWLILPLQVIKLGWVCRNFCR